MKTLLILFLTLLPITANAQNMYAIQCQANAQDADYFENQAEQAQQENYNLKEQVSELQKENQELQEENEELEQGIEKGGKYKNGLGEPKDQSEEEKFRREGDRQLRAQGEYDMGSKSYNASMDPNARHDYATAIEYFRKSAADGNASAMGMMGLMYEKGQGVPKDMKKAVKWDIKAGNNGDPDTQYALGNMYEEGKVVPANPIQAYMWYDICAIGNTYMNQPCALARANLTRNMTSQRVYKGEQLAHEWLARH